MESLRILFVAPYPPGCVRSRSFHLLEYLLTRGHGVTLACPTPWHPKSLDGAQSRLDELRRLGARVVTDRPAPWRRAMNALDAKVMGQPRAARAAWSPRLARQIRLELERHPADVLHVEQLAAACYAVGSADLLGPSAPTRVWDCEICQSDRVARHARSGAPARSRLTARLPGQRLSRYEGRMVWGFDRVLVASPHDLNAVARVARRLSPWAPTDSALVEELGILPSGVDCARVAFRDPLDRPQVVLFSGVMDDPLDADAAEFLVERVMPEVWRRRPEVPVVLVGPAPPRVVRAAARRDAERVHTAGLVPDVAPYLVTAAVSVAPMPYPGGSRRKILESWACGTPVVTDAWTAGALDATHEQELLVAEAPQQYAAAIVRLLADPELRRRLARAGRALVEDRFNWDQVGQQLEAHYELAMAARSQRTGGKLRLHAG
ncbi:MAG: glycosyltransferase family 4 protein [Thermoanaerobaculia bacterium]